MYVCIYVNILRGMKALISTIYCTIFTEDSQENKRLTFF